MSKSDSLAQKFGAHLAQTISLRADSPSPSLAAPMAADRYAGAVKSRAFAELPVDAVGRDESQPREEFDGEDLRRLAESIVRFGQLAPIRVRRDDARGCWVVLVGERRLRACKLAGLDRVRVEFVERSMSQADILAEQTVENMVRAPLSPVEQGKAYQRLMDLHAWTAKDLAETIGVDATAVYRSLALLRLPGDIAGRVDSGEIKATAAYEIAKLPLVEDQRAVAAEVVAGDLGHKATASAVARRRASPKGRGAGKVKPDRPTSRVLRTEAGPRVTIEHRKGLDPALMLLAIEEVAARLRAEIAGVPAA